MKHDDETLQAAIDAACNETFQHHETLTGSDIIIDPSIKPHWTNESPARLALAKAFLAKLPEPQPILADVVLAQAIRRMEAVPKEEFAEIIRRQWLDRGGWIEPAAEAVRARLIAAARDEAVSPPAEIPWIEWHGGECPLDSTTVAELEYKMRNGRTDVIKQPMALDWTHYPDAPRFEVIAYRVRKWRESCGPDTVEAKADWKSRAEKAEEELVTLKSSPIGILRPIAEAGPVPDGCVRINGHFYADRWYLGWQKDDKDTHFADIRIPSTETPAPVNEPPMQQVPLGPEDVMPGSVIRGRNWALDWGKCWLAVLETTPTGVHCNRGDEYRFTSLQYDWQINRSIPLTGKWDANAWQPCYKLV